MSRKLVVKADVEPFVIEVDSSDMLDGRKLVKEAQRQLVAKALNNSIPLTFKEIMPAHRNPQMEFDFVKDISNDPRTSWVDVETSDTWTI
jgi:hypothetical protein